MVRLPLLFSPDKSSKKKGKFSKKKGIFVTEEEDRSLLVLMQ